MSWVLRVLVKLIKFLANTLKTQDMINVQPILAFLTPKKKSPLNKSKGFRLVELYFAQKLKAEGKKLSEFSTLSKVTIFKEQGYILCISSYRLH